MRNTLSRKKARICCVLMWSFVASAVLAWLASSGEMLVICWVLAVVYLVMASVTNRCPNCGEFFKGHYWSKETAGYCRKCGKLMEYDD